MLQHTVKGLELLIQNFRAARLTAQYSDYHRRFRVVGDMILAEKMMGRACQEMQAEGLGEALREEGSNTGWWALREAADAVGPMRWLITNWPSEDDDGYRWTFKKFLITAECLRILQNNGRV